LAQNHAGATELVEVGTYDNVFQDYPRATVILDTNAILRTVVNDCRNGWDSWIVRLGMASTAGFFAAEHVYPEVHRKIDWVSRETGLMRDALQRRWESRYLDFSWNGTIQH
jgi:hypothetical protein